MQLKKGGGDADIAALWCRAGTSNVLIFKSLQVCDWLAKWLIMFRFMDLRRPRVFRCSKSVLSECFYFALFYYRFALFCLVFFLFRWQDYLLITIIGIPRFTNIVTQLMIAYNADAADKRSRWHCHSYRRSHFFTFASHVLSVKYVFSSSLLFQLKYHSIFAYRSSSSCRISCYQEKLRKPSEWYAS